MKNGVAMGIKNLAPLPARHPDWQKIYRNVPEVHLPWHCETLDPDFAVHLEALRVAGSPVIDIGCGTGTQTIALANAGLRVVGMDISTAAIALANGRSAGGRVKFVEGDILNPVLESMVDARFAAAIDRGCFHVLDRKAWSRYALNVWKVLNPGGLLILKCFSIFEPDVGFGPERLSVGEINRVFGSLFEIMETRETQFRGPRAHLPRCYIVTLRRRS